MAKDNKPEDRTTKPKIKQQARRIVNVDGPVTIRGSHAYDAAGTRVTRVGIDLNEDDE